jgi:hypothetical protein
MLVSRLASGSFQSTSVGSVTFVSDFCNNRSQSLESGVWEKKRDSIAIAEDSWKISGQGREAMIDMKVWIGTGAVPRPCMESFICTSPSWFTVAVAE